MRARSINSSQAKSTQIELREICMYEYMTHILLLVNVKSFRTWSATGNSSSRNLIRLPLTNGVTRYSSIL